MYLGRNNRRNMDTLTIIGTVPEFHGSEFIMPADNGDEFYDWLRSNRIDTIVDKVDGKPAVKIRGRFAAQCRPGRKIRYTVERFDRSDGRRIRGVKVESL